MYKQMNKQQGITLIEVIAAIAIMSFVLLGMAQMTDKLLRDIKSVTAAEHIKIIGDATALYIQDNFAAVQAIATPAVPYKIGINILITDGYLPNGFQDINAYDQQVCTVVLEPSPNELQAMVITTGGDTIVDGDLVYQVDSIGASGGGVYTASPAGLPTDIIGSGGSYIIPRGNFHNAGRTCASADGAGGVNIVPGHAGMALWVEQSAFDAGVLYRNAVAGRPDLNQMNTDLDMNGNSILNLEAVALNSACTDQGALAQDAPTGATLSCQSGTWQKMGSRYWENPVTNFGSLPACNVAADGVTRVVRNAADGGNRPRAYTCYAGTWHPLALDNSGNLTVPAIATIDRLTGDLELTKIVTAGAGCPTSGMLARVADGSAISCVSGIWAQVGVPQFELVASYRVAHGSVIGKPACPGGGVNGRIYLIPQLTYVNPGTGRTLLYANNLGASWQTIYLTYGGAPSNLVQASGIALAQIYCKNF